MLGTLGCTGLPVTCDWGLWMYIQIYLCLHLLHSQWLYIIRYQTSVGCILEIFVKKKSLQASEDLRRGIVDFNCNKKKLNSSLRIWILRTSVQSRIWNLKCWSDFDLHRSNFLSFSLKFLILKIWFEWLSWKG